jgi:mannose-6-phosphate isomerase-like protein (cupin superfamily)
MTDTHKNKLNSFSLKGEIKKFNDTYIVKDNTTLNNLVVSSTLLYCNQSTSGHYHKGQEEVYFFLSGIGEMELDKDKFKVSPGDIVLIEDGVFHRVHNTSDTDLYFVCVFDGKRNH